MDIVEKAAEDSMNLAIKEVKDLPHYSDHGEVYFFTCILRVRLHVTAVTVNILCISTVGNNRCEA